MPFTPSPSFRHISDEQNYATLPIGLAIAMEVTVTKRPIDEYDILSDFHNYDIDIFIISREKLRMHSRIF
jgi:hypothetical protein